MSDLVVDSCIAVKWLLPEVDSDIAQRVITETTTQGGNLVLLDLAVVEVTNAIWKRYHRNIIAYDETESLFNKLTSLPCPIVAAGPRLGRGLAIARRYRRSVYDALFVALAEELNVDGLTSDEPLFNAVHGDFPNIRMLRDW